MSQEREDNRRIVKRIIVEGQLVLETPTCLSSGDAEGVTDMMLLRDSKSDAALLTGASITGALRNYLREFENQYSASEKDLPTARQYLATKLFGSLRADEDGEQSPLVIYDSLSSQPKPETELRDGVSIDAKRSVAKDGFKYDLELLTVGSIFPLKFELLIDAAQDHERLIQALAIALRGLENNEIAIGMKKRRGFGHCKVERWKVWQFDMEQESDRLAWLTFGQTWTTHTKQSATGSIFTALGIHQTVNDARDRFTLEATFKLKGSMLIRAEGEINAPDVVHLKSRRHGKPEPILSGTSLAGVLRHRALRIVRTLGGQAIFIEKIFGDKKCSQSSRLIVQECEIHKANELVQSRIAIDRFTGATVHGALFDEQAIFSNGETEFKLHLELHNPKDAEIGLLLLLLKDLWTGDLAIGGGSSIGRGRVQGVLATMQHHKQGKKQRDWKIEAESKQLKITGSKEMEACVDELNKHCSEAA